MDEVNVHEAKTQLSKLLQRVAGGEEITIANRGVPVARLVPVEKTGRRPIGLLDGQMMVPEDFDAPLPQSILQAFWGKRTKGKKKA